MGAKFDTPKDKGKVHKVFLTYSAFVNYHDRGQGNHRERQVAQETPRSCRSSITVQLPLSSSRRSDCTPIRHRFFMCESHIVYIVYMCVRVIWIHNVSFKELFVHSISKALVELQSYGRTTVGPASATWHTLFRESSPKII